MKTIPAQLVDAYQKPGRSTCFCVKLVSQDGSTVVGFTDLDDVVTFNDSYHTVSYDPTQFMQVQNIQATSNLDVDNTELHGWFNDVVKAALMSGVLQSAEVTVYRVAYLRVGAGVEVIAYGVLGTVDYSAGKDGSRKVEFLSLDSLIDRASCDLTSVTCRNDFGDDICGKPFVWEAGTVAEVDDALLRFKVSGISQASGWFDLGVVIFDSGDNATVTVEIESWTSDGWVVLSFPPPNDIAVSVSVRLRQDCDKTFAACKAYNNVARMNAEHLMPVSDTSLMVPGAYIKTNNAL